MADRPLADDERRGAPAAPQCYPGAMAEPSSPISNEALVAGAEAIAGILKVVKTRLPRELRQQAREALGSVHRVVADDGAVAERLALAKELERLDARLRGRYVFVAQFYTRHRLATMRRYWPFKIRGAVDQRWVRDYFVRWQRRADRSLARMHWFFVRCGLEVEEDERHGEVPPWEEPYGHFDVPSEFLWGRITRITEPPPRR